MSAPNVERSAREETPARWCRPSPNPHEWPVTGAVWVDMGQVDSNNEEILDLARRLTRLTLLTVTGLLVESDGCVLEKADVRLIQEVAWAADMAMSEAGKRYLADDGKERPVPLTEPVVTS